MNATPETHHQQLPYEQGQLEDGAPIYDFRRPGVGLRFSDMAKENPSAVAMVKLKDGRSVITDGRAMILVGERLDSGRFPREGATGGLVDRTLPDGIPEMTVGERWLDVGEVERVVVDPGRAYERRPLSEIPPETPGRVMVESARDLLHDFKLTAHAASVGGALVAGSEIVRA